MLEFSDFFVKKGGEMNQRSSMNFKKVYVKQSLRNTFHNRMAVQTLSLPLAHSG